jgi:transposase
MAKGKSYKRYPAQFKRMALAKAAEDGMTAAKVCEELDVSTRQLRR